MGEVGGEHRHGPPLDPRSLRLRDLFREEGARWPDFLGAVVYDRASHDHHQPHRAPPHPLHLRPRRPGDDPRVRAGGREVTAEEVNAWLEPAAGEALDDSVLAAFLNGFIVARRGRRDGPQRAPETVLGNNLILVKLRIALDLQADELHSLIGSDDVHLSRHELSALFRKPGHKHYRECTDELLESFLDGMEAHYGRAEESGGNGG